MKLLNLGCGAVRPTETQWTNIDDLHSWFTAEAPERLALDAEPNYMNFKIGSGPLPFADSSVDGILASHFMEHWDAEQGLMILKDCWRVLKTGGAILVSVPDASYFRSINHEDKTPNWPRLFGVSDPNNPIPTFFEAALWMDGHKAILTEDALWAYLRAAKFHTIQRIIGTPPSDTDALRLMGERLNRRVFSLEMYAAK